MTSLPLLGQSGEKNREYRSAYFLGRGDTGIAIADEEEAIFYNPAGLAAGKGIYKKTVLASPHVEFSQATRDLIRQLGAEDAEALEAVRSNIGKQNHLGIYNFTGIILRRAALGVLYSSHLNLLAYKDPNSGGLEAIDASVYQNTGVTFSVAEQFWGGALMIGTTAKYLVRGVGEMSASIEEADTAKDNLKDPANFMGLGSGGGADVGLMLRSSQNSRLRPAFGLTIKNVGETAIVPDEDSADTEIDLNLKQSVDVGFAIEPGARFSRLRLLLDMHDVLGSYIDRPAKKIHLGAELTVREMAGFSLGINQGYATFGVYLDIYVLRIDLGMYTEETGQRMGTRPDTRFYFRIKTGF